MLDERGLVITGTGGGGGGGGGTGTGRGEGNELYIIPGHTSGLSKMHTNSYSNLYSSWLTD